jgi:predicted esterase
VSDLGFVHVYQPPAGGSGRTLLLLHGTGGDERDLLPLARMLDPSAGVLAPRGKVLENGMPRFFRRIAEGVFDIEDVKRRANELADFLAAAATHYGFGGEGLIAAGFSNGANIAGATLLLRPEALGGAILFRAMVPLMPERMPVLPATPVFLSNGRQDPLVAPSDTEQLAALLRKAGAHVTVAWQPGGHQLTQPDVEQARDWLSALNPGQAALRH